MTGWQKKKMKMGLPWNFCSNNATKKEYPMESK
jgi:hypothetical protein